MNGLHVRAVQLYEAHFSPPLISGATFTLLLSSNLSPCSILCSSLITVGLDLK